MRWLWFKEDIKEAMDASRIHHQLYPDKLEYEYGYIEVICTHNENFSIKILVSLKAEYAIYFCHRKNRYAKVKISPR